MCCVVIKRGVGGRSSSRRTNNNNKKKTPSGFRDKKTRIQIAVLIVVNFFSPMKIHVTNGFYFANTKKKNAELN